jgi:hypothetical protein
MTFKLWKLLESDVVMEDSGENLKKEESKFCILRPVYGVHVQLQKSLSHYSIPLVVP